MSRTKTKDNLTIFFHDRLDWCHLCGKRVKLLADIWYPFNAEDPTSAEDDKYIRICSNCVIRIAKVISEG